MASCSFYEDGEWLIKMIKMNPFKMQNIIDWVQCLLGLVNGRSIKVPQNIASLNFERLKRNQKIYYIFIDEVDPIFSLFKIYDRNGCIVSFGFTENVQKQSYLLTILKKMAKKTFVFILD
uniref:Predicted protein n=1 Tax=Hordeum vulgare subsp. vulgare TaxID=112509 RepID=F2DW41_HORVV|nr:predicted protein [Hordeum vulgare subsp. vulgare]